MTNINDVPWQTIFHAYDTCDEFPEVLQWLSSSDPKKRSEALDWLEELLFHQGTHYEANEFAIPFLIQTAANPTLPDRERFFTFMRRFLTDSHLPLSRSGKDRQNQELQKLSLFEYDFGESAEIWRNNRRRSEAAFWNSRPVLLKMLKNDPIPSGRCFAVYMLAHLAKIGRTEGGGWTEVKPASWYSVEAARQIFDLFRETARHDSDASVRVSATFGLAFLEDVPEVPQLLLELFNDKDEIVRVAAAAARHLLESSLPEEVSQCVVDGYVRNLLEGQGSGCRYIAEPEYSLAVVDAGTTETSPTKPFAFVPFPPLPAWISASQNDQLPIANLIEKFIERSRRKERIRAVRFLGKVTLSQSVIRELLEKLLKHRDPVVRMVAAVSLFRLKRLKSNPGFTKVFRKPLQSRHAKLRRSAVKGLLSMDFQGKTGPIVTALPWVVKAAKREDDLGVRKLLCRLFEQAALEVEESSKAYQESVNLAVTWLGDPAIRFEALTALRSSRNDAFANIRALLDGLEETPGRPIPETALEPLITILNSNDPGRGMVPNCLARIRSSRIVHLLLDAFARESDPEVRQQFCLAIARLPEPAAVADSLLQRIQKGELLLDGPVGQTLAGLSSKMSDQQKHATTTLLLNSLQSPQTQPEDRVQLIEALRKVKIDGDSVADVLLSSALTDPDAKLRFEAAESLALSELPAESILPRTIQIAKKGDEAALDGLLTAFEDRDASEMSGLAPYLLPSLDHPLPKRRKKALKAIGRLGSDDLNVERAVLRRLNDEHAGVRYQAMEFEFKHLPAEEVVPPLLKSLQEPNPSIYAGWNLAGDRHQNKARTTTDVILPVAEKLLASETGLFAGCICDWLKDQGPAARAIVPGLLTMLDDPSPKTRFTKIETLLAIDPSQKTAALAALEPMLSHELLAVQKHAKKMKKKIT